MPHRLSLALLTLALLSAGLLSADAAMNVGTRRALLGGKAAAPPNPVVGCAGTGFNFTLACNSQYVAAF